MLRFFGMESSGGRGDGGALPRSTMSGCMSTPIKGSH